MRKVATVKIFGQVFDLALGEDRAALAREGIDLYERPMAVEIDIESELVAMGNVAMVEVLLLHLAQAIVDRDAAQEALRKGAHP